MWARQWIVGCAAIVVLVGGAGSVGAQPTATVTGDLGVDSPLGSTTENFNFVFGPPPLSAWEGVSVGDPGLGGTMLVMFDDPFAGISELTGDAQVAAFRAETDFANQQYSFGANLGAVVDDDGWWATGDVGAPSSVNFQVRKDPGFTGDSFAASISLLGEARALVGFHQNLDPSASMAQAAVRTFGHLDILGANDQWLFGRPTADALLTVSGQDGFWTASTDTSDPTANILSVESLGVIDEMDVIYGIFRVDVTSEIPNIPVDNNRINADIIQIFACSVSGLDTGGLGGPHGFAMLKGDNTYSLSITSLTPGVTIELAGTNLVPEPSSLVLLGGLLGTAMIVCCWRRRTAV